jgi:hypothetical protein
MAKAGMKRPDSDESYSTESNHKQKSKKNTVDPVLEIQNKTNK